MRKVRFRPLPLPGIESRAFRKRKGHIIASVSSDLDGTRTGRVHARRLAKSGQCLLVGDLHGMSSSTQYCRLMWMYCHAQVSAYEFLKRASAFPS